MDGVFFGFLMGKRTYQRKGTGDTVFQADVALPGSGAGDVRVTPETYATLPNPGTPVLIVGDVRMNQQRQPYSTEPCDILARPVELDGPSLVAILRGSGALVTT